MKKIIMMTILTGLYSLSLEAQTVGNNSGGGNTTTLNPYYNNGAQQQSNILTNSNYNNNSQQTTNVPQANRPQFQGNGAYYDRTKDNNGTNSTVSPVNNNNVNGTINNNTGASSSGYINQAATNNAKKP
ncbi:MAG: hypothetical protein H0X33_11850 [Taibaiella sp.]|nr:hypothetical protein [Taibaiella sp.]